MILALRQHGCRPRYIKNARDRQRAVLRALGEFLDVLSGQKLLPFPPNLPAYRTWAAQSCTLPTSHAERSASSIHPIADASPEKQFARCAAHSAPPAG